MIRRRIIRGFFIGLLVLLLGGWGFGRFYSVSACWEHAPYFVGCWTESGCFSVNFVWDWKYDAGFDLQSRSIAWGEFWPSFDIVYRCINLTGDPDDARVSLGFGFEYKSGYGVAIVVPYWFLVLTATGLLWLGWRKTRPRTVGRAFPVVAKQAV